MKTLASVLPGLAQAALASPPAEVGKGRHIHAKDRAIAWHQDLERRTALLVATASSLVEREAVEAAYTKEKEQGPAFARVRGNAKFRREPTRTALDRNGLARLEWQWKWLTTQMTRVDRKHARDSGQKLKRTLSRSTLDVMGALVTLSRKYPAVFPSIEGIAAIANICRRTAVSALKSLEAWGVVRIERRRKRVVSPTGGIAEHQDTSVYVLQMPCGLSAMAMKIFGWKAECKTCLASDTSTNGLAEKGPDIQPEKPRYLPVPETAKGSSTRIPWWAMLRR